MPLVAKEKIKWTGLYDNKSHNLDSQTKNTMQHMLPINKTWTAVYV